MNPLHWPAAPFLTLYVAVTAAVFFVLLACRNRLGPAPRPGTPPALSSIHIAFLAGGSARALDTALVALFEAGAARPTEGNRFTIDRSAPVAPEYAPFRFADPDTCRRDYHAGYAERLDRIRTELLRPGLVPSPAEIARFNNLAIAALCIPLALGVAKVLVGLSIERPVGILVLLLILTVALGALLLGTPPSRNRAGAAVLRQLRQRHARAARAPQAEELPLAFALTGLAVLGGLPYHGILRQSLGTGSSSDGSSSGDGGGGDGGGGCGGCSG